MGLIKTISKKDVYQDRLNMINESFGEKEQEEADKKRVTDRIGEAIL